MKRFRNHALPSVKQYPPPFGIYCIHSRRRGKVYKIKAKRRRYRIEWRLTKWCRIAANTLFSFSAVLFCTYTHVYILYYFSFFLYLRREKEVLNIFEMTGDVREVYVYVCVCNSLNRDTQRWFFIPYFLLNNALNQRAALVYVCSTVCFWTTF